MRTSDHDPMTPYVDDLVSLWSTSGRANIKVPCPLCSPTRRKRSDPCLSVRVKDGYMLYHCHHCDAKGSVPVDEQRGVAPAARPSAPLYDEPLDVDAVLAPPTEAVWAWLATRGIAEADLRHYQPYVDRPLLAVGSAPGKDVIAFALTDRRGTVTSVQYRSLATKRFKLIAGRPLSFYMGHTLSDKPRTVIITEGQVDALSVMTVVSSDVAVVSLPNGAKNMRFDPDAWATIGQADDVIIATDADAPGQAAAQAIAKRVGQHRARLVRWPEGCNDANDVLVKHGRDMLATVIDHAASPPVEGIITPDDMVSAINDHLHAWPDDDRALTGIAPFDDMVRFARGELTVITGVPGHGKTTFIDQMTVGLARHSGWRTAFLSFERYDHAAHAVELMGVYLGRPVAGAWSDRWREVSPLPPPTPQQVEEAFAFVSKHFVFFDVTSKDDTAGVYDIDEVIRRLTAVHHKYGIDAFVLDNLSFIERKGRDENDSVNKVLNSLILFAKRYHVATFVVAHPRKPDSGNGDRYVPRGYSVAGTANVYNKADIGLTVFRDPESDETTIFKWKQRSPYAGDQSIKSVTFVFDPETRMFAPSI